MKMSTVLVALTALDASADQLLDALAVIFPISAFRGSSNVWLVEIEQDPADPDEARSIVSEALSQIRTDWRDALRIGAQAP
jgi:hypothetical protein